MVIVDRQRQVGALRRQLLERIQHGPLERRRIVPDDLAVRIDLLAQLVELELGILVFGIGLEGRVAGTVLEPADPAGPFRLVGPLAKNRVIGQDRDVCI